MKLFKRFVVSVTPPALMWATCKILRHPVPSYQQGQKTKDVSSHFAHLEGEYHNEADLYRARLAAGMKG